MQGGLSDGDFDDVEVDELTSVDDDFDDDDDDDDDDTDNVGDLSVEINIAELVDKLEATSSEDVERRRQIRRRIEELREIREAERDLDSTYNFNLDDDD